jgi:uncharacterized protein YjbI with pentapeptide repeats
MVKEKGGISEKDHEALIARWNEPDPGGNGTLRDTTLKTIKEKCTKHNSERPAAMDLRGIKLAGEDLSGLDLSGYDLAGSDLMGTDLNESILSLAKLQKANFFKAKLDGCELFGAQLEQANLNECSAKRAGFGAANLEHASFFHADLQDATLSKSKSHHTDFRAANLERARVAEADLSGANFTRANLRQCDLKASNVHNAIFELADMRNARILGIINFTKAAWIGADIRGMDLRGAYLIRRYIADENYLYEFKTRSRYHRFLYVLWWITSDCGRSIGRWTLCIFGVTLLFSFLYGIVEIDYGSYKTAFSPFYFSVVTLTTLGFGDVVPSTFAGQILVVTQAILGYVGLGGLLSIMANKIARRAD